MTRRQDESPRNRSSIPSRAKTFVTPAKRRERLRGPSSLFFQRCMGFLLQEQSGRSMKLTTHAHLVPILQMRNITPCLHSTSSSEDTFIIYSLLQQKLHFRSSSFLLLIYLSVLRIFWQHCPILPLPFSFKWLFILNLPLLRLIMSSWTTCNFFFFFFIHCHWSLLFS